MKQTFTIGIGGAAGQGVATPGDIFAKIFSRRGLHLNAYNAYQSIIRGGHTFLTIRTGPEKVTNMGDRLDLLIPLNRTPWIVTSDCSSRGFLYLQRGYDQARHCGRRNSTVSTSRFRVGGYHSKQGRPEYAGGGRGTQHDGHRFPGVGGGSDRAVQEEGRSRVAENIDIARAGYDYASANFKPFAWPLPMTNNRYAVLSGNIAMAMGGAAAGVKFYCAYPMSPSTGVLHWMAAHARKANIMVRQVEDEIGVVNMAIGAAHAGVRSMCATSGGGFALMSEGLGLSAMMETPVVVIDCQRAGPSTGVPTKTEQGDFGKCWARLSATIRGPSRLLSILETASRSFPRFSISRTAISARASCFAISCCRKDASA